MILLLILGLSLLTGCMTQGDFLELRSQQMADSGEVQMMKRDTKAALERIEELERQINLNVKMNQEKLDKLSEAVKDRGLVPGPLKERP